MHRPRASGAQNRTATNSSNAVPRRPWKVPSRSISFRWCAQCELLVRRRSCSVRLSIALARGRRYGSAPESTARQRWAVDRNPQCVRQRRDGVEREQSPNALPGHACSGVHHTILLLRGICRIVLPRYPVPVVPAIRTSTNDARLIAISCPAQQNASALSFLPGVAMISRDVPLHESRNGGLTRCRPPPMAERALPRPAPATLRIVPAVAGMSSLRFAALSWSAQPFHRSPETRHRRTRSSQIRQTTTSQPARSTIHARRVA